MTRDLQFLMQDIIESISRIEEYTEAVDKEGFLAETWVQDAVIRRLEVIGEAVKNMPTDFRARYPDIPWAQIAGMKMFSYMDISE